jgi:hypothetical protein
MATTPPPKPPVPAKPEPQIQVPKLGRLQRNAANEAVESAREWLGTNGTAVAFQAHKLIDARVAPLLPWLHKAVDDGMAWGIAKLTALKF